MAQRLELPVLFPLAFALALSAIACDLGENLSTEGPPPATAPESIVLETLDGLQIHGTFQVAVGASRGPAVLLLHSVGENHDRRDVDGLFAGFLESSTSVLAIDLRSHGESDDAPVSLLELESDSDQMRWDVQAALSHLGNQPQTIDPEQVGVVGLSLGGSMGLVARHESDGSNTDWGARAVAAISSRLQPTQRLTPDGDESLSLSRVLLVAGAVHSEDAEGAEALYAMSEAPRELLLVEDSSAHGGELLAESPEAESAIVDWVASALSP